MQQMAHGALRTLRSIDSAAGFFVFSTCVVFAIFTTFLLPLWSLSFATEALGREREAQNLLWLLTRPLSRPAIYLAKFVALLPWSLRSTSAASRCSAWPADRGRLRPASSTGRRSSGPRWPSRALFHLMGAWFRRAGVVAILYAFFLETIMGNMPGYFKRLSISFYTRCLMFDRAHDFGIQPERPADLTCRSAAPPPGSSWRASPSFAWSSAHGVHVE